MTRTTLLGYWLLFAAVFCCGLAQGEVFTIDPADSGDTVYFRSSARLEFIEGKTNDLLGGFQFDPRHPANPVSGILRVDLRTLKTGIDTRDRHMRERHLHTDTYPYAYFELTGVSGLGGELKPDTTYMAGVQGFFYIHGHKRCLEADMEFRLSAEPGGLAGLAARVSFALKLDEYEIERPKALFLKLAETIEIEVILSARNDLKSSTLSLPAWELLQ